MKTLQDLEAEQTAARAKLEAEHEIAAALPLVPDFVLTAKGRRAPYVTFRNRTLTQALEIIGAFQIVPMWKYRDSCLSICPEGEEPKTATEDGGPFAIALDVDTGNGYGPSAKLFFYSELPDGRRVRVNVDIDGPGYIGAFQAFAASRSPIYGGRYGKEIVGYRMAANQALSGMADSVVSWASGDNGKSGRHSYLLQADQAETLPAAEMSHALAMLVNLRDEFQPEAELVETTAAGAYWRFPNGSYAVTKPGAPAPAWGHGYTLEFCKAVTEPKEESDK